MPDTLTRARFVYAFGGGRADGDASMRELLGGALIPRRFRAPRFSKEIDDQGRDRDGVAASQAGAQRPFGKVGRVAVGGGAETGLTGSAVGDLPPGGGCLGQPAVAAHH